MEIPGRPTGETPNAASVALVTRLGDLSGMNQPIDHDP